MLVTRDALFNGSVVLFQPARGSGYRTNVDALLLAGFAKHSRVASLAFDLGAGVGAVGLGLLRLDAARRVILVEIDEAAAALARRNLDANGWTDRGEVLCGDVRELSCSLRGNGNLVVCNPPYIEPGRGRVPPAQAVARSGDLGTFVAAARQVAGRRARVCFVYPAYEVAHLLSRLAIEGLHAKRMRFVHGTADVPARVVLVEATAGRSGGVAVMPALIERGPAGYTAEMEALLSPA
ncbi:MAG: methyltransferase [Myxococcota bacterium]|nr:methyltransferase [Myxococcota bacterium]